MVAASVGRIVNMASVNAGRGAMRRTLWAWNRACRPTPGPGRRPRRHRRNGQCGVPARSAGQKASCSRMSHCAPSSNGSRPGALARPTTWSTWWRGFRLRMLPSSMARPWSWTAVLARIQGLVVRRLPGRPRFCGADRGVYLCGAYATPGMDPDREASAWRPRRSLGQSVRAGVRDDGDPSDRG